MNGFSRTGLEEVGAKTGRNGYWPSCRGEGTQSAQSLRQAGRAVQSDEGEVDGFEYETGTGTEVEGDEGYSIVMGEADVRITAKIV